MVTGNQNVGGLVGSNNQGQITDSYATGNVSIGFDEIFSESGQANPVGGLIGFDYSGQIHNTYATGNVSGFDAGGLIGFTQGGESIIADSYATGDVEGSIAGGLIGNVNTNNIHNSYSTGNIIGHYSAILNTQFGQGFIIGGFIGYLFVLDENDSSTNYIHNSGWYKSTNNQDL